VATAPGHPGIPPRWTSSAKDGVGTALSGDSPIWFTLSHGIVDEVYYPRPDLANIRDFGLVVTDGAGFFSEEKRDTVCEVHRPDPDVPVYRLTNTCRRGRYRIHKTVWTDPRRPVLLVRVEFEALRGTAQDYRIHALVAPHIRNHGAGNTAWVADHKGVGGLFARRDGLTLALFASPGWGGRSVGYVGTSDGWQDLRAHGRLTWTYDQAPDGNVALIGELDLSSDSVALIALGFGRGTSEASLQARSALVDAEPAPYADGWRTWHKGHLAGEPDARLWDTSAMVLKTHQDKTLDGATVASLSIPWGFSKGDDDLGGYHLVWSRDMVETAEGFLALGAGAEVRDALTYLRVTQEADGSWTQNMWIEGDPYWTGQQMDETALPVLLVDHAWRAGVIDDDALRAHWRMVRKAAAFLVRNGPVTQQDRWEEDPGYTPFTLATEIAALLAAAALAERVGEGGLAPYLRETADTWNAHIERWIYAEGTDLARRHDVRGYYVRVTSPDRGEAASALGGYVPIKNRPPGSSTEPAEEIVSTDALALVRFGLRAPDDPRIVDTVRVIDALLRIDTPNGPTWHRYNDDGYGEHEDGSPFDGTGVGRGWPLLTGERAHYEVARGDLQAAGSLMRAMEAFASDGGMIPEQVWDSADIPERELFLGRPSGSAMPLVWAHAEYLNLARSIREGRVFDMPPYGYERYVQEETTSYLTPWRFNHRTRTMPPGNVLRIEVTDAATVHWSTDGWKTANDTATRDSGLGMHYVDVRATPGKTVVFTFHWTEADRWEGADFEVRVEDEATRS
jgi:glucoamylase